MRINYGLKVEKNNFIKKLFITAKAEEVADPTAQASAQQTQAAAPQDGGQKQINFEDLIVQARAQEKAKLYPRIEKLENDNKTLVEKNNANLLSLAEKDSEIASLNKQIEELNNKVIKGASDREKELLSEIEKLKKEKEDLETNTVSREEIEEEIKSVYEVKLYREQKLREVGDNLIPELVTGFTKEEIDQSIAIAQQRFNQIQEKIIGQVQLPVTNTSVTSFQQANVSLEDIAKLDPSSPEYAQLRAKLGVR